MPSLHKCNHAVLLVHLRTTPISPSGSGLRRCHTSRCSHPGGVESAAGVPCVRELLTSSALAKKQTLPEDSCAATLHPAILARIDKGLGPWKARGISDAFDAQRLKVLHDHQSPRLSSQVHQSDDR